VELQVEGPASPVERGGTAVVALHFRAAASDGKPGGIDEIAALTFSVGIADLELADCRLDGNGLTPAFTVAPEVAERFLVRVQNLTCERRDHCLCPTGGQTRDPYVNLTLTGPIDLFGGELRPEDLPLLSSGELLSLRVRVLQSANQSVPLQVFNRSDDQATHPKPTAAAFVSVGDNRAADVSADAAAMVSNVRTLSGTLVVTDDQTPTEGVTPDATPTSTNTATLTSTPDGETPLATPTATETAPPGTPTETPPDPTATEGASVTPTVRVECVGDCGADGVVSVDELIMGIGIALDQIAPGQCPLADRDQDGTVTIDELLGAVNAALSGCQ
jgi:hypothetical protein